MTLPLVFHDLAEEELNETAAYYARARPGLGDAFLIEVRRAIDALLVTPLAGTLVDKDVRWWLVKRFPYSVLYRVRDDHVRVLAIAHQKRRPFYWRGRRRHRGPHNSRLQPMVRLAVLARPRLKRAFGGRVSCHLA